MTLFIEWEGYWKKKVFFKNNNISAYKMDSKSSIDIDKDIDFKVVEMLID